jgi:pilus assembly protein CpaB
MAAGSSSRKADFIGRGVVSKIYANEPILENRLAAKGAGGGLAAMIPPGMRAVAVRVNEVVGVAGFVTPGSRVDVLISGNPPGNHQAGNITKTLLQNIEVMSAGQDFKKDSEGKPVIVQVVNLLVTPEQAEVMSLAVSQTTIQLVLRNPLDMQVAKTTGAALASIFGGGAPKPAADPEARPRRFVPPPSKPAAAPVVAKETPKPPFVMEIISGGKRVQAKFEAPAEAK